jgi:hypothetical protein
MVQESYIAKIKREAQEKKELAKATTKATTKENSPQAKDADQELQVLKGINLNL